MKELRHRVSFSAGLRTVIWEYDGSSGDNGKYFQCISNVLDLDQGSGMNKTAMSYVFLERSFTGRGLLGKNIGRLRKAFPSTSYEGLIGWIHSNAYKYPGRVIFTYIHKSQTRNPYPLGFGGIEVVKYQPG